MTPKAIQRSSEPLPQFQQARWPTAEALGVGPPRVSGAGPQPDRAMRWDTGLTDVPSTLQ